METSKANWFRASVDEMNNLIEMGDAFEEGQLIEAMMEPAVKELLMEFPMVEGTEVVIAEIHNEPQVNSVIKEVFEENGSELCMLSFYCAAGRKLDLMYHAVQYDDGNGHVCFGSLQDDKALIKELGEMERCHVQGIFSAFAALQYLMLHESGCFSKRKEYKKGVRINTSVSKLVAPYTQPGKVIVHSVTDALKVKTRQITHCMKEKCWHCPAWGVRGHYRHYKTGRVVYIKPYINGKDKSAYSGREYSLISETEITEVIV